MNELLSKLIGREIDVACAGAFSLRGQCTKVEAGVLQLKDDQGEICYIAIDKIVAVWEKREKRSPSGISVKKWAAETLV